MKTLIVICLTLLCFVVPAAAQIQPPWEHDNFIQAGMMLYNVPGSGTGILTLIVNCTWEKTQCVQTKAYLTTDTVVQREVPAHMVTNAQGTHAVVTLLDGSGSTVTWRAKPGEQRTYHQDDVNRGKIITWFDTTRFIYDATWNYSYVVGTLLGAHFDSREMPWVDWSWVQIAMIFQRWLPAPTPGPNHGIPTHPADDFETR